MSSAERRRHPALAPIFDAMDRGRLDAALVESERVVAEAKAAGDTDLAPLAHRLAGLARFHLGDYAGALPHIQAAAEGLDDRVNWFLLAITRTQAGQVEAGAAAFSRALDKPATGTAEDMSDAHMHFDYMHNLVDARAFEPALAQLQALRQIYARMPSTAPAALVAQRVPLLVHTLDNAVFLFKLGGRELNGRRWLKAFAKELDPGGRQLVQSTLEKVR